MNDFCYFFNLLPAIVSWCMTCMSAVNIGNLSFSCLLIIWVYSLSQILNISSLVDPVNILRNSFLIFYLDKQHPSLIGETTDRVTELFFPFLDCGCSHEDTLIPISSSGFNWSSDGWSTYSGCLAVFPRLKGRKHSSLFFLFDYFVALITDVMAWRSTEYHYYLWASRLTETVFLLLLLLTQFWRFF